jgi:alpha-1,2-glucosyltransferase
MVLQDPFPSLKILRWYLPVPLMFGLFIIWNGGIVLGSFSFQSLSPSNVIVGVDQKFRCHKTGHQEHHIATLHTPQLFYFLAFSTIFGWPVLLNEGVGKAIKGTLRTGLGTVGRVAVSMVVLSGMIMAVRYQT